MNLQSSTEASWERRNSSNPLAQHSRLISVECLSTDQSPEVGKAKGLLTERITERGKKSRDLGPAAVNYISEWWYVLPERDSWFSKQRSTEPFFAKLGDSQLHFLHIYHPIVQWAIWLASYSFTVSKKVCTNIHNLITPFDHGFWGSNLDGQD